MYYILVKITLEIFNYFKTLVGLCLNLGQEWLYPIFPSPSMQCLFFTHFCPMYVLYSVFSVCPNGTAPMCCKLDLCVQNSCPSNPTAKCRINPCGGCKVEFYDDKNTPVDCDSGIMLPEKVDHLSFIA